MCIRKYHTESRAKSRAHTAAARAVRCFVAAGEAGGGGAIHARTQFFIATDRQVARGSHYLSGRDYTGADAVGRGAAERGGGEACECRCA